MDVRCSFIINNLQSSREKAFNARNQKGQVNPKGLPILFALYYLNSILLSYIIKLYYLKSFRVVLRHYREKEKLLKLCIKVCIIIFLGRQFLSFFKKHFEPNSLTVSLSLLKKEIRSHLKLESSLILSYQSSWQALKICTSIISKSVGILFKFTPS